ncbi:MAG: NAD-dependent epimerase/dehydratase family protein, partial [Myxococcales bacterium]|nr:NAD-dependent epimerase/dehydratase family protein [Myxococcales bacterium]
DADDAAERRHAPASVRLAGHSSGRVVVAGASGFLGARLAEMLAERGTPVRALVRPSSDTSRLREAGIEVAAVDWADAKALGEALADVDAVINCAGLSADWGKWERFYEANVRNVERLLEASEAAGVRRFVHVSTTDVYGYPKAPPGEDAGPHDIGLPYNRSKGLGDSVALEFARGHRLEVTVARPVTIFGPHSKDWVIEIARLLRTGDMPVIDGGRTPAGLVYVDDVAEALIGLTRADDVAGKAYNVRDPSMMNWRTYVDALADGIGARRAKTNLPSWLALRVGRGFELGYGLVGTEKRPLLTRHAVLILCRDQSYPIDRLIADTGFKPTVGVEEGIRRTLQWLTSDEGLAEVANG